MDGWIGPLLAAAGFLGGIVNAVAGGATLITFPAMLAAGLPPVIANASNAVAIFPGHFIAALADREKLPSFDTRLLLLCSATALGGLTGAALLLILPARLFVLPVPGLIAFATLLFAFAPRIQAWAQRSARPGAHRRTFRSTAVLAAASVYGGFFGAGLGVVLTAVLAITEPNDIRAVKVLKNLLATCVTATAMVVFITKGMVAWRETLVMLAGALAGGYAGGRLIRVLSPAFVRWLIIVSGSVMAGVYAQRYWWPA
ncbi:putative membrane protein YfcA [Variovorax boronicumulans]|uniref:sulfite exporter TauE/SafE family protein n=1 Tax=Variovorax boronicumulans TaxID=436515 RepID=UPI0027876D16|nr:sulfite exporter TauE/SafE family protein [Variovorax boronicumulans]MDQ0083869.1 putative membrane protein YfcA [Variovorax boronicumulans]